MINEMTYEEILAVSHDMKNCCRIISKLIENKKSPDLEEFVQCVENYTKYLDSTIELMTVADMALQELIELKK